jgi:hypothetical protein
MRRLISDRPRVVGGGSDESDLLYFLQSYDKLDAQSLCSERIDVGQVVAWVFVNGQWESHSRPRKRGPGSWCQVYLTSILGLNPAQYDKAKKELFKSEGLSGVYKHHTKPTYALVYKPSNGLSAASIAALAAGGAAAVGAGGFAVRHAIKKRETKDTEHVETDNDPSETLEPSPSKYTELINVAGPIFDNFAMLDTFNQQSQEILKANMNAQLTPQMFPKYSNVGYLKTNAALYRFNPVWKVWAAIESLIDSKETQSNLISLINRKQPIDYDAWRDSYFWESDGGEAYVEFIADEKLRDRIKKSAPAREQYSSIVQLVEQGTIERLFTELDSLSRNMSRRDESSMYYRAAFEQLIGKYGDRKDIYLALRSAELPFLSETLDIRPIPTQKIKTDYEQVIEEDIKKLEENLVVDNAEEVETNIKQLQRNIFGYSKFDDAKVELVQRARAQQNSSERLLARFKILAENKDVDLLAVIREYDPELKKWKSSEELEKLLTFADTFIDNEDDTSYLKEFRLWIGPLIIDLYQQEHMDPKKLQNAYNNRIKDLIEKLKSRDEVLEALLPEQDPIPDADKIDIQNEIQQLYKFVSAYDELVQRAHEPPTVETQVAKDQVTKTSKLLERLAPEPA